MRRRPSSLYSLLEKMDGGHGANGLAVALILPSPLIHSSSHHSLSLVIHCNLLVRLSTLHNQSSNMVKLFAKRKKKVAGGDAAGDAAGAADQSSSDPPKKEEVETRQLSYFDKNFRPGSSFADKDSSKGSGKDADEEVQRLLAMNPSELNSKQRRILKRYRARNNISDEAEEADNNRDVETKAAKDIAKPDEEKEPEVKPEQNSGEQYSEKEGGTDSTKDNDDKTTEDEGAADDGKSLAEQLKGLNSKERRKLLRKLRRDDPEKSAEGGALAEAEDEAKKIAEQNRKEQEEQSKKRKREVDEEKKKNNANGNGDQQAGTEKKKGKKSKVDWSTLPPEERARREKQREMQQEAKRRREAGEVDETRHPLNSERRRANRRKPGRAGKIAALVRAERAKKKEGVLAAYNASGYTMRKNKKMAGRDALYDD